MTNNAMLSARDAARAYIALGFAPVPVPYRKKGPVSDEWEKLKIGLDEVATYFKATSNIGLILGDASHGLVDIDLDCAEAIRAADVLLPRTPMVSGRRSAPRSHRWFRVGTPTTKGKGRKQFLDPLKADGETRLMVVEYRSTGHQTVVPPSVHQEGEAITWMGTSLEPTPIEEHDLLGLCSDVAGAALLARYWPNKGGRHDAALALAGWLQRGGKEEERAKEILEAVAVAAGDDEVADRVACVETTYERIREGKEATGFTRLQQVIDRKVLAKAGEWLGLSPVIAVVEAREALSSNRHVNGTAANLNGHATGTVQTSGGDSRATDGAATPIGRTTDPHHRYERTDVGNGDRFADRHGGRARWVKNIKQWIVFDGRIWRMNASNLAERLAAETTRAMLREASRIADPDECKALAKWALASQSDGRIQAMLRRAAAVTGMDIESEALDQNEWLLSVRNGTIDLRTGVLRKHSASDFITKMIDLDYDPDATAPLWLAFLNRVQPDKDIRDYLQRAAGYSATGSARERRLLITYGIGQNGKGVFLQTIRSALGEYAERTPTTTFMSQTRETIPNDIAALRGVRFVFASETKENGQLSEATVKDLTGGEDISARFMHGNWFSFTPTFTPWIATNHRPIIRGQDEAIWDRLDLIPFTVRIPEKEQDQSLLSKLKAEHAGILTWIVAGARSWFEHGLKRPPAVVAATRGYRDDMDALSRFIADECFVAPGARVPCTTLYATYTDWARGVGERPEPDALFRLRMKDRGFETKRNAANGANAWQGIGLAADESTEALKHTEAKSGSLHVKKSPKRQPETGSVPFSTSVNPPGSPVWGCPDCGERQWKPHGSEWVCIHDKCGAVRGLTRSVGDRVYPVNAEGQSLTVDALRITDIADRDGVRWCALEGIDARFPQEECKPAADEVEVTT